MQSFAGFIDCHCHLLPAIDDGAKDPAIALEMAQNAVAAGVRGIVCTPHHLNGVFKNSRKDIIIQIQLLREALAAADIALELYPGSELHLVPELPEQVLAGEALTYNDQGKAVLVELPTRTVPMGAETILEQLIYHKITPIIAHPERNAQLAHKPEQAEEWVSWGCKLQLTAQSCSSDFGRSIQDVSRYWCERGMVHIIASDAHRPYGRAPDTLLRGYHAIVEWLGEEAAVLLTQINPQHLLDGEALESLAPTRLAAKSQLTKKSWLRRMFGHS